MPPPRYRIHAASAVNEQLLDVFVRATARGQRAEAIAAAAKIEEGLTWLADELGESRFPLKVLGEMRVVVIGPVGAVFAVDRAKLEVHVGRFRLLGVRRENRS
jgi:hypothetical protein